MGCTGEEEKKKEERKEVKNIQSQRNVNFKNRLEVKRRLPMQTEKLDRKTLTPTFHVVLCCLLHFKTVHVETKNIKREPLKIESSINYSVSAKQTHTVLLP